MDFVQSGYIWGYFVCFSRIPAVILTLRVLIILFLLGVTSFKKMVDMHFFSLIFEHLLNTGILNKTNFFCLIV